MMTLDGVMGIVRATDPEELRRKLKAAAVNPKPKSFRHRLDDFLEFCDYDEDPDENRGFIGWYNLGIGLSDGEDMMEDMIRVRRDEGQNLPEDVNYCFYHMQDADTLRDTGVCHFAWRGDKELMMNAFREAGFEVDPGKPEHRFAVREKL